jgi:hypothetical protein
MTGLQGICGTRVGEWRCGGDASNPTLSFEEKSVISRNAAAASSHVSRASRTLRGESKISCPQRVSSAIDLFEHFEFKGLSRCETLLVHPTPQRGNHLPKGREDVWAGKTTLRSSPGLG